MHTGTGEMPLSAKSNTQDSSAAGTALQCFSNTAGLCSQSSSASKPTCTCAAQTSPATPSRFRSTHPSLLQQKREECLVFAGTDLRSTSEPGQGLAFSCISTRCPSRPGHVLPCWLQGRESKAPAASVGPSSPITCSLAPVPIHTQQGLLQAQPPAAGHISTALLPLPFPSFIAFHLSCSGYSTIRILLLALSYGREPEWPLEESQSERKDLHDTDSNLPHRHSVTVKQLFPC